MKSTSQLYLAEKKLREIMRCLDKDDFDQVKKLLDRSKSDPSSFPSATGMRYIYARLEEEGAFGGNNNPVALSAFSELSSEEGEFQSEGLIGRARMLYRLSERENANEVLDLCERAVSVDGNAKAMMIMGHVLQNTKNDFSAANRWYLRAFFSGMPWGLRFYASSQAKQRRFFLSSLAHLIAAITSPILLVFFDERGPYK
ncbi:hypothetical protein ACFCQI_09935 [Rhodanobacter sp. FW102-FHT14D06]|uniref:Sel1 repeat family protein n=2 Tax=unclassified Rhodanobacter TaxID=2621553 RepID=A0AB74USM1_9GAMM